MCFSPFLAGRSRFLCLSDASLFWFSPGFPVLGTPLSADVLLFPVSELQLERGTTSVTEAGSMRQPVRVVEAARKGADPHPLLRSQVWAGD